MRGNFHFHTYLISLFKILLTIHRFLCSDLCYCYCADQLVLVGWHGNGSSSLSAFDNSPSQTLTPPNHPYPYHVVVLKMFVIVIMINSPQHKLWHSQLGCDKYSDTQIYSNIFWFKYSFVLYWYNNVDTNIFGYPFISLFSYASSSTLYPRQ